MITTTVRNEGWRGLCAVLILSASLGCFAQNTRVAAGLGPGPAENSELLDKQVERIHFEQIPLVEVVRYLREEFDGINFILSEELKDVPVELELRHVSIVDILEGLNLATDGLVHFEQKSERLFYLAVDIAAKEIPQLRAFNLRNYFSNFDGDQDEALRELYQVLENGWNMMRKAAGSTIRGSRPELSIHEKTQLLIAVGQEAELHVVESIVDALHGGRSRVLRPGATGMYGGMGAAYGGYGSGGGAPAREGYSGGYGTSGGGRGSFGGMAGSGAGDGFGGGMSAGSGGIGGTSSGGTGYGGGLSVGGGFGTAPAGGAAGSKTRPKSSKVR